MDNGTKEFVSWENVTYTPMQILFLTNNTIFTYLTYIPETQ